MTVGKQIFLLGLLLPVVAALAASAAKCGDKSDTPGKPPPCHLYKTLTRCFPSSVGDCSSRCPSLCTSVSASEKSGPKCVYAVGEKAEQFYESWCA